MADFERVLFIVGGHSYPQRGSWAFLPTEGIMVILTHRGDHVDSYPQRGSWSFLPTEGIMVIERRRETRTLPFISSCTVN
jgi:hypothetical protein